MTVNAKPLFLEDNLARVAWKASASNISASTEDTGYPAVNSADWRAWLRWIGTGSSAQWWKVNFGSQKSFDSFAIFGHDLNTQGAANIKLEGSNNDADWDDIVTAFTPSTDKPFYKSFNSVSYQYARFSIPSGYTSPPSIGTIFIGPKMQMPKWSARPFNPYALTKVTTSTKSHTGQHTETTEKYSYRTISLKFKDLTKTWFEANILPFENDHIPLQFGFVWDETNHPNDVFLVKKKGKDVDADLGPNNVTWNITIEGVVL
jgi:F5/8 type C domain